MRELFADGTLDSTWAQVADFSEVTSFEGVSSEGLKRQAMLNPWPVDSLRVIITPTDLGFGLGRMYQMLTGKKGENIRIVRSRAEAVTLISQERDKSSRTTE